MCFSFPGIFSINAAVIPVLAGYHDSAYCSVHLLTSIQGPVCEAIIFYLLRHPQKCDQCTSVSSIRCCPEVQQNDSQADPSVPSNQQPLPHPSYQWPAASSMLLGMAAELPASSCLMPTPTPPTHGWGRSVLDI